MHCFNKEKKVFPFSASQYILEIRVSTADFVLQLVGTRNFKQNHPIFHFNMSQFKDIQFFKNKFPQNYNTEIKRIRFTMIKLTSAKFGMTLASLGHPVVSL